MNQTIDILMATYNSAEYVISQLQSIMEQTYPHFRITIRDDSSLDHTVKLIEDFKSRYPDKIHLIKGNENLGALGNFATLLNGAQADYIMFSDADDIWLPNKIEESLALMQKNESLYGKEMPLLVHTDLAVADRNLQILNNSFWDYSKLKPERANSLNRLLAHNVITGCTMMINKFLLQLVKSIPKEAVMHDWWIGLVAAAFGRIDYLAKSTVLYRQHGKNDIGAKNWKAITTYLTYAKKGMHGFGREELRQRLLKTIRQASHFLKHFDSSLDIHQKRVLENYVALGKTGVLKKRYLFLKHRFFKNTLAKNIGVFLFL